MFMFSLEKELVYLLIWQRFEIYILVILHLFLATILFFTKLYAPISKTKQALKGFLQSKYPDSIEIYSVNARALTEFPVLLAVGIFVYGVAVFFIVTLTLNLLQNFM